MSLPARTWWIWAGHGAHLLLHHGAGNSWTVLALSVLEATVKVCGVAVAMPSGQSRAPPASNDRE